MERRRSSVKSIKGDFKRGNWASKTEFLLSCMGYAIGIGNVWRFPYLCYRNGGGAFLVPYLIMLFLCGIPLFFMETSLGQFSGTGCITLFKIAPLFKGAGFAIVIVNFMCTVYYIVIIAYPILFMANCFQGKLPWADCNNDWNTEHCLQISTGDLTANVTSELFNITQNSQWKTPSDEYFHNKILQISSGIDEVGSIVWPLFLCDFIAWTVVYLCIMNGVHSVGKVVYFTATFPFVILFVLLIRGVTLPGAWDGISFYIYPQWSRLGNLKVWTDAAVQIFFSLGPGWGGIINMASYNEFRNNSKGDAILVPILNSATSIFAGFVVFSILGFMAHKTGLPVSTVATGGPGLAFVTYPEAITMLPWSNFWAVMFFFMLFLLGLDTCFVQIEAIISSVIDEYPFLHNHKKVVTLGACVAMFLCSTIFITNGGMYLLQLFDWYAASISVILICLVEVLIVAYTYGSVNFIRDIEFMLQKKVNWWWKWCWKFITPAILTFIFVATIAFNTTVTYNGFIYPDWAVAIGWCTCGVSIICIPTYMGYHLLYNETGDCIDRIQSSIKPSPEWGPASDIYRKEWNNIIVYDKAEELRRSLPENGDHLHEEFVKLCNNSNTLG
uniref:Transporter n=1 Tax=Photinus pyralis TaxID=7054 RepID=A0A1Y1MTC4_PHOPY